jgi:hypothetical protein
MESIVTKQNKVKTNAMRMLDKHFEMYLYESSEKLDELYINGGQRGIDVCLRTADLLAITGASVIQATSEPTRNSTVK